MLTRAHLSRRTALRSSLLLAAMAAAFAVAPGARATTAAEAIAFLNQQRAANGMPPVSENPAWSQGCALHNHYLSLNPAQFNTDPHSEYSTAAGYTDQGLEAATNSVLATGEDGWSATTNPYETAPLHLQQVMNPWLLTTGFGANDGYQCMNTQLGEATTLPDTETTYVYTGLEGRFNVPASELAREWPTTPQQELGLSTTEPTGPNLMFYIAGPENSGADGASWSITGPNGPVDTRALVAATSPDPAVPSYVPDNAAFVFSLAPLEPNTTYQATMTWTIHTPTGGNYQLPQTVSFTTAPDPSSATQMPTRRARFELSLSRRLSGRGRNRRVKLSVGPAAVGHRAITRTWGHARVQPKRLRLKHFQWLKVRVPKNAKRVKIRISVPSFSRGAVKYSSTYVQKTYRLKSRRRRKSG